MLLGRLGRVDLTARWTGCTGLQGGYVTTSEVDVLVTQRDNDVIYQCHGTNEQLGQTVVDTITLTVMCTLFTVSLPQSHLHSV